MRAIVSARLEARSVSVHFIFSSGVKSHLRIQLKRLQFYIMDSENTKSSLTSIGSTSLAKMTSWAFFFSMSVVTVLTPCLTTAARLVFLALSPAVLRSDQVSSKHLVSDLVSTRWTFSSPGALNRQAQSSSRGSPRSRCHETS